MSNMKALSKRIFALTSAGVLAASTASAATLGYSTTDLNLRAGPGPNYVIKDVIAARDTAEIEGCLDERNWCKVTYNGEEGWAYGDYLSVPVTPRVWEFRTVTYNEDAKKDKALLLGSVGAAAGALIGGPLAVVAGAAVGGVTGAETAPEEKTVTYLESHPVDPIFLNGEVVVGAVVPEGVEVYSVPETEYAYLNVNGEYVLVEPANRQIVHIVRQ